MKEGRNRHESVNQMIQEFISRIDLPGLEDILAELLLAGVVLLAGFFISRTLQRFVDRRLRHEVDGDEETIRVYKSIAWLVVWTPALLIVLHVLGFNVTALGASGGLFAVATALAMKDLSEEIVAGVALRLERAVKPGDVLESGGTMVRVKSVGLRATVARTGDEKDLIIPNSELVHSAITNYTYSDPLSRIDTTVGVAYESDLGAVREALEGVCGGLDWKSPRPDPVVLLSSFGDSTVNFMVKVWIEDPWQSMHHTSLLNEAIWRGLQDADIVLAFPQLDVHFDQGAPPMTTAATG